MEGIDEPEGSTKKGISIESVQMNGPWLSRLSGLMDLFMDSIPP